MNYMRSHKTEIFNDIISESLKKGSRICCSKTIIGDSEMEETYSYDKHGNLTCIRNSEGYYEEYEYDERGNIILFFPRVPCYAKSSEWMYYPPSPQNATTPIPPP